MITDFSVEVFKPDETASVASLISEDLDRVLLVRSTAPSAKHHKLTKATSMEGIAGSSKGAVSGFQFSSSGKVRSKRVSLLLKLKNKWRSDANIVISPPIQDDQLTGNVVEFQNHLKLLAPRNATLYKLDRKKSLSTGNLFGTYEASQISKPSSFNPSPNALLSFSCSPLAVPEVPKRTCSYIHNCTADDQYLHQKGKQLQKFSQRWSDPTHDQVEDVEPDYDSPTDDVEPDYDSPTDVFEPLYDIPHSSRAGGPSSAPCDQTTALYVNSGIGVGKGSTTFNGSQIHTYDTPRPASDPTHSWFSLAATGNHNTANETLSDNEEDNFDGDYVDMCYSMNVPNPPPALPLKNPIEKAPPFGSLASTYPPLQQGDRPWSSHFTNAPPALPPWPVFVRGRRRRSSSTHLHPPLAPCNSFDETNMEPQAHMPASTSTPCLHAGQQENQKKKMTEDEACKWLSNETDSRPSLALPSSASNPDFRSKEISTLVHFFEDLNSLASVYN